MKSLTAIGLTQKVKDLIHKNNLNIAELARVIAVHKDRYIVKNQISSFQAEITGNLRYSATDIEDFPAVGDWVRIITTDKKTAIIIELFDRISVLKRQAVGKGSKSQLIACNVNFAFITMSADRNFNLNRLDRYISICSAGNIKPIITITKCDLISDEQKKIFEKQIRIRYPNIPLFMLSINNSNSLKYFNEQMLAFKTYCFVGSSGVGKSTIVNYLLQSTDIKTATISTSNMKGKHTTTHRELFILPNDSIVIDTPGMRELGIMDQKEALDITFERISKLSVRCKYSDCTHTCEKGCAVLNALDNGDLDKSEYESYQKLKREQMHYSQSVLERKQIEKNFAREIKEVKIHRKKNKF
ncbi:MAG: ribosome small subunit-dependent GTPase A [Bacteroidales bacterium]|nr:ribosome small subunit-dependent GTPase A [Bacteroidales bacterium]